MKAFPEAKVVLTVREPEAWFNSVKNTIYQLNADALSFPGNILSKFIGFDKKTAMIQKLSRRNQNRFNQGMFDVIDEGKEASIEYFNAWLNQVKSSVPKEKLLIFDVKQGWKPLCQFLNLPIPKEDFPKTNDTAQMKKRIKFQRFVSYGFVCFLPLLLGFLAFYFMK